MHKDENRNIPSFLIIMVPSRDDSSVVFVTAIMAELKVRLYSSPYSNGNADRSMRGR